MRRILLAASLALAAVHPSLAQSATGPGPGAGTTPVTGTPSDLDLPLDKPVFTGPTPTPTGPTPTPVTEEPPAPVPDDGGDDPRDEPPPVIYGEEIDSESDTIIYVLDHSGSMDWDEQSYTDVDGTRRRGTRMERAKCELNRSILGLAENFSFNIVAYTCATSRWSATMRPATAANKSEAVAWVRAIEPDGATGTGPAVSLALSERDNMSVVLLTDGAPNCGVWEFSTDDWLNDDVILPAHQRMIRDNNIQHATINVFGIAASGDYRRFCMNVAADSGGSYFDVP